MIGKKVLVTTDKRGVFFGTLKTEEGTTVELAEAQNCTYWSRAMRGFLGLAVLGPDSECRIGPPVPKNSRPQQMPFIVSRAGLVGTIARYSPSSDSTI